MTITKDQWQEIVNQGALVPPYYEPSRSAGELYAIDESGELDESVLVGHMPNTYFDIRYQDYPYYSFTALRPDKHDVGVFSYNVFDEDEGTYDDDGYCVEIDDLDVINSFTPEKELLEDKK